MEEGVEEGAADAVEVVVGIVVVVGVVVVAMVRAVAVVPVEAVLTLLLAISEPVKIDVCTNRYRPTLAHVNLVAGATVLLSVPGASYRAVCSRLLCSARSNC